MAQKKQKKKVEPAFKVCLDYSNKDEMSITVKKNISKNEFMELNISKDCIEYDSNNDSGELTWEELSDAISLVSGNLDPVDYFCLEVDDDGTICQ